MIKTRIIRVKNIEHEEIIMTITVIKTILTKVTITIIIIISVQVKAIDVCLKRENVQKAIFD